MANDPSPANAARLNQLKTAQLELLGGGDAALMDDSELGGETGRQGR